MTKENHYQATITWTGNKGLGTKTYNSYDRNHTISIINKADILASSDAPFLGDPSRHNPEELLVSALSGCHMLWYLHLCSTNGITVVDYTDHASGTMKETAENGGHFTEVVLRPIVTITDEAQIKIANELHDQANNMCFIANSCNFPVRHIPSCSVRRQQPI
jgi:organic hydroperoxide reductase OsmC/OhrA